MVVVVVMEVVCLCVVGGAGVNPLLIVLYHKQQEVITILGEKSEEKEKGMVSLRLELRTPCV